MYNLLASQLNTLGGIMYVHVVDEMQFRAVFFEPSGAKKMQEQTSDYTFEHAFYLLYAKLIGDPSMETAIQEKYKNRPIPGIGHEPESSIDRLLLSKFIRPTIGLYEKKGRVVAEVQWMGTKKEIPGMNSTVGYGDSVNEAIVSVLNEKRFVAYCVQEQKKEPVCL